MKGSAVFQLYVGYFFTIWVCGDFCFLSLKLELDWKVALGKRLFSYGIKYFLLSKDIVDLELTYI